MVDSLARIVKAHPEDTSTCLAYANALYDVADWETARIEYESYLKRSPRNADAIVDYAYVLEQTTHDPNRMLAEIEKALEIDPEHLNALINTGICLLNADSNRIRAAVLAEPYFVVARRVAEKKGDMDTLRRLDEIFVSLAKLRAEQNEKPGK